MARDELPLLEREGELAVIAQRVAEACEGAGGLLMVEGAAGIGKTRLVQATCQDARERDMTVLATRAGELERGLPYGIVRGLFEAPVARAPAAERDILLAGAARLAAPVLGIAARDEAMVPDGGSFTGLHGLYWLTVNLAERAPLLLAVDDVHWADGVSLSFLVYLLRRVEALPVLIVLAGRPDELDADEALLARCAGTRSRGYCARRRSRRQRRRCSCGPRSPRKRTWSCAAAASTRRVETRCCCRCCRTRCAPRTSTRRSVVRRGWRSWRRGWLPRRCLRGCAGCRPRPGRSRTPSRCWVTASSCGMRRHWPGSTAVRRFGQQMR